MEWMPGHGVRDLWTNLSVDLGVVWRERAFPGLWSFQLLLIHCPSALESLATQALLSLHATSPLDASIVNRARHHEDIMASNGTFVDQLGQVLKCNEPALGVHFVKPFHSVPWVHRFLNFWAGAQMWDLSGEKGRDLRIPSGQWTASSGAPRSKR